MKHIFNILKNPMLLQKPESNFLGEIYNGKESKRITKEYLKSFSKERRDLKTSQLITNIFFNIILCLFIMFCIGLILLGINR